jgi:group II intron reverse transcriptase/maturase
MEEAPTSKSVSTKLQRIAEQAREAPGLVFTNLSHLIDVDFLREAYRLTNKKGAAGVDGLKAEDYDKHLEANLQEIWSRLKAGRYRAPAVRRVRIPKEGKPGETRPLGIPTLEDKAVQRAVAMVLSAIYEQDFNDCSYGFRPKRSAHQAIEQLRNHLMELNGGWVLEVDIKAFFDNVDHGHLRSILDLRIQDKGIRRLIGKWLKAGVLEAGTLSYPSSGTPQGGVVSPILANIYLHEVLDQWFHHVAAPRLQGRAKLIRFADDFIIVFARLDDAQKVMSVLSKRFLRFGLTIHPDKTRLVDFRRTEKPGHFDFLGFTYYWRRSRKGNLVVGMKTAKNRLKRAIRAVTQWCQRNRHQPVQTQRNTLARKLLGHCGYYGLTGNSRSLQQFRQAVIEAWKKWLNRRSYQAKMTWAKMMNLLKHHPLPPARVVHSICRVAKLCP